MDRAGGHLHSHVGVRRRRWRVARWGLLVAGVAAVVAAQLAPTGTARADSTPLDPGSAIASASVLGAVPIVGNTNLAVTVGDASASYQEDDAMASSQTIDLGGLGVILANTPFCGDIVLPADKQPPPLTDDSGSTTPQTTNHLDGAGSEGVTATASPESSSATTTPVGQVIPGLITVGGIATSAVSFSGGTERVAKASVQVQVALGNGLVALHGVDWSAEQQTGVTNESQGSFTVGSITVGSTTLPTLTASELSTALGLANKVLAALGLTINAPTVTTNQSNGTVTVTPLQITVGKSALSNPVVSPLVSEASALEAEINGKTSYGPDCANIKELEGNLAEPSETVANVALGAFSNGGGFDLDVGGANADTQPPPSYANPFGSGSPAAGSTFLPPVSASATLPPGGAGAFSLPPVAAVPPQSQSAIPSTTSPPPGPGNTSTVAAVHCVTTSPSGAPGCWTGDATIVGAVAVGAGAFLFLADVGSSRRSRRRAAADHPNPEPEEVPT